MLLTYLKIVELSIKPDVCALCEEYITKALDYLHENKTETEIISILHNTCHQLPSFKQKVGHPFGSLVLQFRYCSCCEHKPLISQYAL